MKKVYLKDVPGFEHYSSSIKIPYNANIQHQELLTHIKKYLFKNYSERKIKNTIGILDKIACKTELEDGLMLITFYLNTYCKRDGNISTQIKNEKIPEFSDAPENINYCLDFLDAYKFEYFRTGGINSECVFSVVNKERADEPYVLCTNCNGEGKIKCPQCGGSGREQYTDGYYASGEERIKTGHCSECQGYGKIDCPECNGQGKIEIFAPHYSIVKSVKENYTQRILRTRTHTWEDSYNDMDEFWHYETSEELYKILNTEGVTRFLKKNRKEIIIDNSQQVIQEMKECGVLNHYKLSNKKAEEKFSSEWESGQYGFPKCVQSNKGDLICQQEIHYLLPMKRLKVSISNQDAMSIYLLPYDEKSTYICLDNSEEFKETGTLKYLFYKLFK